MYVGVPMAGVTEVTYAAGGGIYNKKAGALVPPAGGLAMEVTVKIIMVSKCVRR